VARPGNSSAARTLTGSLTEGSDLTEWMALDAVEYRTALAWVVAMQSYAMASYRYGG